MSKILILNICKPQEIFSISSRKKYTYSEISLKRYIFAGSRRFQWKTEFAKEKKSRNKIFSEKVITGGGKEMKK